MATKNLSSYPRTEFFLKSSERKRGVLLIKYLYFAFLNKSNSGKNLILQAFLERELERLDSLMEGKKEEEKNSLKSKEDLPKILKDYFSEDLVFINHIPNKDFGERSWEEFIEFSEEILDDLRINS